MMGQFPEFAFTPAISFFVNCQTQAEVDNLVALTSAFATPLAGRLYDKIGPRIIMVVGFSILCVNTWQLSQLQGTTPISYIFFLLALRELAIGLTLKPRSSRH
jgi:nitrate/nitrite transporter NarK